MAAWQWKRWDAVARLGAGKLTVQEAAQVLGLSVRQVRRIRQAVARAGRAGLQHGNAGQVPVNKLRATVRNRILRLRRTKYRDFNDAGSLRRRSVAVPVACNACAIQSASSSSANTSKLGARSPAPTARMASLKSTPTSRGGHHVHPMEQEIQNPVTYALSDRV